MSKVHDRGQWDGLVELAGAIVPAGAAAFAAAMLAPIHGWPLGTAMLAGFGGVFVATYGAMRLVRPEPRTLALPDFETIDLPDDVLLLDERLVDDVLLLDRPCAPLAPLILDQPLVEAASEAVAELLLDDPLPSPAADSRVVQLFAGGRMPTAGQMKQRIDRHLADNERPDVPPSASPDASDALSAALAELRHSLRQA